MRLLFGLAVLGITTLALAQVTPRGTPPPRGTPGTAPARGATTTPAAPLNIDRALENLITLNAKTNFGEFTDSLRKISNANIVVSWNALALTGITRETPIEFHVKDVTFEYALKALMEVLPATESRPNFYVSDNALTITTNNDIGKGGEPALYNIGRAISISFAGATATPPEKAQAEQIFQQVLLAEVARAGDPLIRDRGITVRDGTVVATLSERGHTFIERAIIMLGTPLKVGQIANGIQVTAQAKRAQDALKAAVAAMPADQQPQGLLLIARDPAKYRDKVNILLFPGTAEELAKPTPVIGMAISDGGIVLIGPRERLRQRTIFAAYDLRDLIKKLAAKPPRNPNARPADYQTAITRLIMEAVKPDGLADGWGELGKSPTSMTLHNGMMMIFATPETHRGVIMTLQDMNK